MKRTMILSVLLLSAWSFMAAAPGPVLRTQTDDPSPPEHVVKLIFIHHSTGENWLRDDYGGLGQALGENNYFVSGTNYGWGPDSIGDHTDIPDWLEWFHSANTDTYMEAVFNESGQNSDYTRTLSDPGGENEIIMFKSCFPNSILDGSPNDPPTVGTDLTVGNAKYIYNQILQYFAKHPDKLFVVITAPPVQDAAHAANARAFNQWLINDWLKENNYSLHNVAVFDFYNVLTSPNAHHWVKDGAIQHIVSDSNTSYYPSASDDDHPSAEGSRKATDEFVPLLNIFYHHWKNEMPAGPISPPAISSAETPAITPAGPLPAASTEQAQSGHGFTLPCGSSVLLPLVLWGLTGLLLRRVG